MKQKENLILVHSFPTNSILLEGLIAFLNDYFKVYFIDLPGFTKKSPLNKNKVSFKFYSNYLSQEVKKLNLKNYIIGGISFGFIVVNEAELDAKKCKAILAIEPYINNEFLHISFLKRFLYTHLLDDVFTDKFSKKVWQSPHVENILRFLMGEPNNADVLLKELDYRTFFQTAKILIKNNKSPKYRKDVPYVLWINKNDKTISSDKIISEFSKNIENLLIKFNEVDHYPKDMSKKYFRSKIKAKDVLESIFWINSIYNK